METQEEVAMACAEGDTSAGAAEPAYEAPRSDLQIRSRAAWGDRYMEAQGPGAQRGQHALNNLLGVPQYDGSLLEQACQLVMAETGEDERLHRRGHGWYSHSVLSLALDYTVPPVWRMLLRPASSEDWGFVSAMEDVAGVLCN
eukprot:1701399-Heterocapsa_arctica.AAC.1